MPATKYTYSISGDFPNGKVEPSTLTDEISASSIAIALDYINTSGDNCDIWFIDVLSGEDQTTLTTIVGDHEGIPFDSNQWGTAVLSWTATPPGSPNIDDRHVVATGATGVWAGKDDCFAQWGGSSWAFTHPEEGTWVFDSEIGAYIHYNGAAWNLMNVFGSEYEDIESLGVSTTTADTYQEKLQLGVTVKGGRYRLGWSFGWNHDDIGTDFKARIQQDDTTDLMVMSQEPADAGGTGTGDWSNTGTSQRYTAGGFILLTLSAGSYDFHLDYCSEQNGKASSIWDARFDFWRVS